MLQEEVLSRYRHLRAISLSHHGGALHCLIRPVLLEQAKHLGLAVGEILVAESEAEITLLFDLAIHTAKSGRSRAIDRYASSATLPSGSDEALTLEAMRRARFSLWRIGRQHEIAGVMVTDLLRDSETWLLDEGLALSAEPGMTFASRLCWPADFAMTLGVIVPVDAALIEDACIDSSPWLRHVDSNQLADHPRFAEAIYRTAIEAGVMDNVAFRETALAG